MLQPGETICISCSSVCAQNARFCQCGACLIKTCINPQCLKEISSSHERCDYCGWLQNVSPNDGEGARIRFQIAKSNVLNPDGNVSYKALDDIMRLSLADYPDATQYLIQILADPSLIKHAAQLCFIIDTSGIWEGRKSKSAFASELIYFLVAFYDKTYHTGEWIKASRALSRIARESPESYTDMHIKAVIEQELKHCSDRVALRETLEQLGKRVLEHLKPYNTFFGNKDVKGYVKKLISDINHPHRPDYDAILGEILSS
jgi:hypothetical protein